MSRVKSEPVTANGSPALMRRMNATRVLQELRARGPLSRADLARRTGLSKPTVTSVVADLQRVGYVLPAADDGPHRRVGRRPLLFRFRSDLEYVLGVDIGADKLLLLLAELDGNVVASKRRTTRQLARRGPKAIIAEVAKTASQLFAEAGIDQSSLLAVVAGTPGVVSAEGVVTLAPQLGEWEGLDLRGALSDVFDCPVHIEREVSLSLLAERWRGVAQGVDDALYIHLGVGVGAALLINGEVYRGADGAAGEIGSMPLGSAATPLMPGFGPFESVTGGAALARAGQAAAQTPAGAQLLALAGGDPESVDAAVVFTAADAGDAGATAIVAAAVSTLAQGLACLVCALNPHTVVISGGLSRAGDVLLGPLQAAVTELVPFTPRFLVSTLGDETVALGALRRATETLEYEPFLDRMTRGPRAAARSLSAGGQA
jgi:predicted NBD/HSP70 family sugar kinase